MLIMMLDEIVISELVRRRVMLGCSGFPIEEVEESNSDLFYHFEHKSSVINYQPASSLMHQPKPKRLSLLIKW